MKNKKFLIILNIITWLIFGIMLFIYPLINIILVMINVFLLNYTISFFEERKWNNGICKKTNKPWEYSDNMKLSNGDMIYYFESENKSFTTNYITIEDIEKTYKGNNIINH